LHGRGVANGSRTIVREAPNKRRGATPCVDVEVGADKGLFSLIEEHIGVDQTALTGNVGVDVSQVYSVSSHDGPNDQPNTSNGDGERELKECK